MTDREQALFAYIMTIRPHVTGATSINDFGARVMKCMLEDLQFVGKGFAASFLEMGRTVVEKRAGGPAADIFNALGRMAGDWASERMKKPKP